MEPFPCDDTFPGVGPFSEVETQNSRDFFLSLDPKPTVAMALHANAERWLYPYSYDYGQYQDNVDEVVRYPMSDEGPPTPICTYYSLRPFCRSSWPTRPSLR